MSANIEALVDALIQCARNEAWTAGKKAAYRDTETAKAALLAACKGVGEPVGYITENSLRTLQLGRPTELALSLKNRKDAFWNTPLYTRPTPPLPTDKE